MAEQHVDVNEHSFVAWYDELPSDSHLIPFIVIGTVVTDYRVVSVELKPARQPGDIGTTLNLQIIAKLTPPPPPGRPHPGVLINQQIRYDEKDRTPHWKQVNIAYNGKQFTIPVTTAQ